MKIIISFMFMLTMGAALYADEVVLTSSADTAPKWVTETNQWTIVTNKKAVTVYFKAGGTSDIMKNAEMMAKAESIGCSRSILKASCITSSKSR